MFRPDKPIYNFINGDFVPSEDGQTSNDINPSTGDVVCTFPSSSKTDVENAVKAANAALFSWSTVPKVNRKYARSAKISFELSHNNIARVPHRAHVT